MRSSNENVADLVEVKIEGPMEGVAGVPPAVYLDPPAVDLDGNISGDDETVPLLEEEEIELQNSIEEITRRLNAELRMVFNYGRLAQAYRFELGADDLRLPPTRWELIKAGWQGGAIATGSFSLLSLIPLVKAGVDTLNNYNYIASQLIQGTLTSVAGGGLGLWVSLAIKPIEPEIENPSLSPMVSAPTVFGAQLLATSYGFSPLTVRLGGSLLVYALPSVAENLVKMSKNCFSFFACRRIDNFPTDSLPEDDVQALTTGFPPLNTLR